MRRRFIVVAVLGVLAALLLAVAFMNRDSEPRADARLSGKHGVPAGNQAAPAGSRRAVQRVDPDSSLGTGLAPSGEEDRAAQQQEMVELARIMLSTSMQEFFPNLNASESVIGGLATATLRLRDAQAKLDQLAPGPDNDELRRELSDEVAAAADEFANLIDTTMGEFGDEGDDYYDDYDIDFEDADGFLDFEDLFDPFDDDELTEAPE